MQKAYTWFTGEDLKGKEEEGYITQKDLRKLSYVKDVFQKKLTSRAFSKHTKNVIFKYIHSDLWGANLAFKHLVGFSVFHHIS